MKKVFYVFAAAVVMVACTKEWPWADKAQPEITRSAKDGCYELFVSIDGLTDEAGKPVGESIETKAAINETNGQFTWAAGDKIDVVTTNAVYQFEAAEAGAKARFVYDGDDFSGTPLRVEYPSTQSYTPAELPDIITGNMGALSSANLRLTGDVFDGNNVNVHHKNALVRLEFHDVPTFASKLVFDGSANDVTVTFTPLVSRGKLVAYVPVDVATTSFSVSLMDNNNNVIVSKSTTSAKSFTAGTLKVMASVAVEGWVFQFDNASSVNKAHFHKTDGYTISWDNPSEREWVSLNSLAGGSTKWYILKSNETWKRSGDGVCIQMYNDETWVSRTDCVFLYRDFVFDLSIGKMKADYNVYWDNSSQSFSNVKAYVWSDTGIYVYCSDATPKVYYWIDGGANSGSWLDKDAERYLWEGKMFYFYKLAPTFHKTITGVEIGYSDWHCSKLENYSYSGANHFFWYYNTEKTRGEESPTWDTTTNEFLSNDTWPGDAITLSGNIGSFIVPSTKFENTYNFLFSDDGAAKSKEWHLTINREYKLSD